MRSLICIALLACSAKRAPGTLHGLDNCQPTPCIDRGMNCGSIDDGCGFAIVCGACVAPEVCQDNVCVCAAETDAAFCARAAKNCGVVSDKDNCGADRTAACGTCATGPCIGNVCTTCTVESDAEFCARQGFNCGVISGTDNCGSPRSAVCGSCLYGTTCASNVCSSLCEPLNPVAVTSGNYANYVAASAQAGNWDGALAISPDGRTIIHVYHIGGGVCSDNSARVYIGDALIAEGGAYQEQVLRWEDGSGVSAFVGVCPLDGCAALLDRQTAVLVDSGYKTFSESKRSGPGYVDFSALDPSPYAAINALVASGSGHVREPSFAAAGLALYFRVTDDAAVNGFYVARRASLVEAFATPVKLTGTAIDAAYGTSAFGSVSQDELTLMLTRNFALHVMTRANIHSEFFDRPVQPALPAYNPLITGDCSLIFMRGGVVGGCVNEDILFVPITH